MSLVCPQCRQGLQVVGKFAVCPDHGQVEPVELADGPPAPGPADRPKVFISYGRKDARELVDRLCVDLAAAEFDVWRDTREIRSGTDWQAEIVDGLRSAQVVVAVLTPHSVRTSTKSVDQIDSVCLGEIAYALFNPPPRPVVPVMAQACEPPLAIYHLDYVDLCSWQASDTNYRAGLARLIDGIRAALRGEKSFRAWHHQLRPLDFAAFLYRKRQDFTGREWLFDRIDAWRTSSARERSLLIKGEMGVGKSAIVAQLIHRNPDGQVLAYHCCQWDEDQSRMPGRFVQTIAGMIASKIEAYAHLLEHDPHVKDTLGEANCASDPQGAWQHGVLEQLEKLPAPEGAPRYLLIDALDEALLLPAGATLSIVDLLATRLDHLPGWLRVVATTRNHPDVLQRLRGLRAEELDAQAAENLDDLRIYLGARLNTPNLAERLAQAGAAAERVLRQLLDRSEGNFLYANLALEAIERDQLDVRHVEDLPPGLAGLYENRFHKEFPSAADFAQPKLVLEAMAAAQEPLDAGLLAAATGLDAEEQLPAVLKRLATYGPKRPGPDGRGVYTFHHKSLSDWLTSEEQRGRTFFANTAAGHRRLADVGWSEYLRGVERLSSYARRYLPAHLAAAHRWDELHRILTDLNYYEARNAAGEVFQLTADLSAVWLAMPEGRLQRKVLQLLDEALRRDIHFIDRHREDYPQGLFQCLWNHGWWYDCPDAAQHYATGHAPGADAHVGLYSLLECWRKERELSSPGFPWLRTLRPPPIHLGSAQLAVFRGHKDGVNSVAFSPDGTRIASGSLDNTIRVWDGRTGAELQVLRGHDGPVDSVAFSPDGTRIASGSWDNTVRVWDTRTATELRVLRGHTRGVGRVAFSPDGTRIASGSGDNTVRVWDARTGAELQVLRGHENGVNSVAFSPDGTWIASGSYDFTVRVWDARTGAELQVLRGHDGPVDSVAFSPDGTRIASGSADCTVRVWDVRAGAELQVLRGHEDGVNSVAFSPDGTRIASGSRDCTVRVWDARTGAELQVLRGHERRVYSVAFSPDGTRIASGSWDKTVRIWDVRAGAELQVLRGHEDGVNSVAFSPDGTRIASGSRDCTVRVWDARTGAELQVLRGHERRVYSVAFSPDGARIVSSSWDHTIRIWDARTGDCIEVVEDLGDVQAYAAGADEFPWRALRRGLEMVVEPAAGNAAVAWFPAPLYNIATHPSGRLWAGAEAGHVWLLRLENAAETIPSEKMQ